MESFNIIINNFLPHRSSFYSYLSCNFVEKKYSISRITIQYFLIIIYQVALFHVCLALCHYFTSCIVSLVYVFPEPITCQHIRLWELFWVSLRILVDLSEISYFQPSDMKSKFYNMNLDPNWIRLLIYY